MATGNRLSTEIMINLAGNLTAKARQYGANMSQFARNHQKAMNFGQSHNGICHTWPRRAG